MAVTHFRIQVETRFSLLTVLHTSQLVAEPNRTGDEI